MHIEEAMAIQKHLEDSGAGIEILAAAFASLLKIKSVVIGWNDGDPDPHDPHDPQLATGVEKTAIFCCPVPDEYDEFWSWASARGDPEGQGRYMTERKDKSGRIQLQFLFRAGAKARLCLESLIAETSNPGSKSGNFQIECTPTWLN